MAKVRIKMVRAYDSSSGTFSSVMVPDMFRALQPPYEMEETKADLIVAQVKKIAEEYNAAHPGESFMPTVMILSGRKPSKIDEKMKAIKRNWLLRETDISTGIG